MINIPRHYYSCGLLKLICHLGESSMNGSDKSYKYNDSIVSECENDEYLVGVPYILFYQQIDT